MDHLEAGVVGDDLDLITPQAQFDRAVAGSEILQGQIWQPIGQVGVDINGSRQSNGMNAA